MGIPSTPGPTPQSLGYDPSLSSTPRKEEFLEEYFNSAESTNFTINDFQAIGVKEGEWIGSFLEGADFEFEIIVDTDHVTMDLEYAEKSIHLIDATGLAIDPESADIESISTREAILNYIDPAAFYGMHNEIGVNVADWTGGSKNLSVLKVGNDLALEILDQYLNKDAVYLDLRGDRGYSYYYYQNYRLDTYSGATLQWSETFKLKSKSQASFAYMDYAAMDWPLINLNSPQFALNPIVAGEYIELKLLVNNNEKPLVFLENPKLLGASSTNNFVESSALIDPAPAADYTLPFILYLPYYNDGSSDVSFAHHIKVQYFQANNNITGTGTFFKSKTNLDNAYSGIELDELDINTPFSQIQSPKRHLISNESFSFVNTNGIFQDDTRLLFYSENAYSLKTSGDSYPVINPTLDAFGDLMQYKNVALNKWQINDGTNNIDLITIAGYNRDSSGVTPKEDLMLLGLLKSELSDLNGLTGLSNLHHKYFVLTELFDAGNPFMDTITLTTYRKFRVDIQGVDSTTGQVTTIDSSSLVDDVYVYGISDYVLCTSGFASTSTLPYELPDPGELKRYPAFGQFEYDSTDPTVTGIFNTAPTGYLLDFPDNGNNQGWPRINAEVKGLVRFPANSTGKTDPADVATSSPLIVIVHGNGQDYDSYDELAEYLALNGFIVASISGLIRNRFFTLQDIPTYTHSGVDYDKVFYSYDTYIYSTITEGVSLYEKDFFGTVVVTPMPWTLGTEFFIVGTTIEIDSASTNVHGMASLGRANLLFAHLQVLKAKFLGGVQNKIGLLGHSRGGETVVKAASIIGASSAPVTLNNIEAIMSLAPTDQYDVEELTQGIPYHVLFGSMDGDTTGLVGDLTGTVPNNRTGGFSLYDRAINITEKSMTFVQGATHNGFITNNHDYFDDKKAYGAYLPLLINTSFRNK